MKIYSYRIKINKNLQENVQSYPFINSKDKNINTEVINDLKSDKLEIRELSFDPGKSIINWDNKEAQKNFIYKFFEDKIKTLQLEKIISKETIKHAILRFGWKFEKINFNKKTILSLGSGDGIELFFLRLKFPESKIYAVDWTNNIDSKILSGLEVNFEKENIYDYLKKKENTFDFIYSSYLLEHSYNVNFLLTLINKSLVSDGILASNLPLISFFGTPYYNFLKKSLVDKNINQIDGGLIDLGHPWKTNEYDLYKTLENSGFKEINIYGNAYQVVPHTRITMHEFIRSANLRFKLNIFFIKPFKSIINKLFGNNINYWILKIFFRVIRELPIGDNRIANYVPEVLFIAKKTS